MNQFINGHILPPAFAIINCVGVSYFVYIPSYTCEYCWPLNSTGVRGTSPAASAIENLRIAFDPQNLLLIPTVDHMVVNNKID